MKDIVLTIVAIGTIFVGIPLLIVWMMDRGGAVGLIVKRIIGAICLLFGVIIIGWVAYNLVWPTDEFKASVFMSHGLGKVTTILLMPVRLVLPLMMVGLGWHWMTSKRDEHKTETENQASEATSAGKDL